jgi:hypothetical protein
MLSFFISCYSGVASLFAKAKPKKQPHPYTQYKEAAKPEAGYLVCDKIPELSDN